MTSWCGAWSGSVRLFRPRWKVKLCEPFEKVPKPICLNNARRIIVEAAFVKGVIDLLDQFIKFIHPVFIANQWRCVASRSEPMGSTKIQYCTWLAKGFAPMLLHGCNIASHHQPQHRCRGCMRVPNRAHVSNFGSEVLHH